MAIKPWVGAIKEPSFDHFKDKKGLEPKEVKLSIDYVHGIRTK
jgi:hypothetical protein